MSRERLAFILLSVMPLPFRRFVACWVFGIAAAATAAPQSYVIDPSHSSAGFAIHHLFLTVRGAFAGVAGTVEMASGSADQDRTEARIEVAGLDTGIRKRDSVLKSPDYFDAVKYPVMIFRSKSWRRNGSAAYAITGDLTIKNVTREVVLEAQEVGASAPRAVAFDATAELSRKDFGVVGPSILDKPIGDKVQISIHIEADLK
jgi:polyisoprenoid-binding protein YceI